MRHRPLSIFGIAAWSLAIGVFAPATASAQDAEEGEATEEAQEETATSSEGGTLRRSNRMEFDARLIRGETAGSGAVFLFQRAPRALPSMVPLRKSYLQGTVDEVLGEEWESKQDSSTK